MRLRSIAALAALASLAACRGAPSSHTPPAEPAPVEAAPLPAAPDHGGTGAGPEPDDSAGFADPPGAEAPPNAQAPAAASPELAVRIQRTFGDNCRYERACGELIGVDCDAAVDGPYYYVHHKTLAVVSTCGGACMQGCTNCPPSVWTCATY